jgi:hypothetical protein
MIGTSFSGSCAYLAIGNDLIRLLLGCDNAMLKEMGPLGRFHRLYFLFQQDNYHFDFSALSSV